MVMTSEISTVYRVHVDGATGAVVSASERSRRRVERLQEVRLAHIKSGAPLGQIPVVVADDGMPLVERGWSPELEAQLRKAYAGVSWRPQPKVSAVRRLPRATGKPSRDLSTLHKHLVWLASSCPQKAERELAAALVRDIEAAMQTWAQEALPLGEEAAAA